MEVLLMYMENHQRFDTFKMKESLRDMDEVLEINEADLIGADLMCKCKEDTIIHLSADCEFLAIRGHKRESLEFALAMQKKYGGIFHLTDEAGHFDTVINGEQQYEELNELVS